MSRQFGTAKYGGDFKKNEYRKLKDGRNVYRILPPIGDLAKDGKWSVFYSVHYGYTNSAGKLRPFVSPLVKNRKSKMIEVPDAALERIETLKAQYAKAKQEGNKKAIEALEPLVGKKAKYNLDNNHHVNALDEQGNVVVLKLRHRAKLALDEEIKRLRGEGVEPLGVENGRVFVFTRTGTGLDTSFKVEVLKEKLMVTGVGEVERALVSTLDQATVERCLKECADLDKLYKRPTADEVARIVKESDLLTGKSRAVDEILDAGNSSNAEVEEDNYDDEEAEDNSKAQAQTAQSQPAATQVAQSQTTQSQNQAAATQAAQQPVTQAAPSIVAPKVEAAPAPATTAKTLSDMSTDEFLASLNMNN